jgi:hypothetical protein
MSRDFSVYERELKKIQDGASRRSSGSGDFVWLTTNKPSRSGEQNRQRLRVVPRPDGNGGTHDEFWVTINQHMINVDGKVKALVCPDEAGSSVCPLCKLSRELYDSRKPEYLGLAKDLSSRTRVFANVCDLEDESHPDQPKVWGFSRTIHHSILDICMAKRSFIEDLENGRDILLTTRRIGPQKFDIRYAITDMDSGPIDPDFLTIASKAHDLESLAKPAVLDELHEIAAGQDPRSGSNRASYTPDPTPAPAAAPEAAPKAAPAPAQADDNSADWHYSGAGGQDEGLTAMQVAKRVAQAPDAAHHVWRDGMAEWLPADEVEAIKTLLTPTAPPAPPKKAKKAKKAGPPAPPTPRGGEAF